MLGRVSKLAERCVPVLATKPNGVLGCQQWKQLSIGGWRVATLGKGALLTPCWLRAERQDNVK